MKKKNYKSKIKSVSDISVGDSYTATIPSEHKIPFIRVLPQTVHNPITPIFHNQMRCDYHPNFDITQCNHPGNRKKECTILLCPNYYGV